ncbi:cell cycle checkpoint control protein RAD9A [Copidosoma floridanum]|uniref:cell cycle checkpoint control protein RAD9A n=1 Tax=Copidosoma floridanum TaxID=29053 RepID=UPI0006C9DC69|nr:cell cycle checkpoint control protein RAD9A [Copidosoma floridanum]
MKCIVSGGNIKILARAVQMLSKIGDEMFVQPQEDCLSFRSVNGTNSAYVDVTFQENYFSYYAYEDLERTDALRCKILIRSALAVFKSPSLIDKQVESCHIQLEEDSEKLCFIVKYKNSVIKTHLLPILDCETIRANYKKDGTANNLCIQPRVMNDIVQNFQQGLLEITVEVLQDKVLIRNYIDETSNVSNETRTQLVFGAREFDKYAIESDTVITFCLKELRAILCFSEALGQPIEINFDKPGKPVVFVCKSSSLETNLVLATLNPDTDSASQSTVSTRRNPVPKKAPKKAPAKAKQGIKSLSKKSFDASRVNNNSLNTSEVRNTESVGRISDVTDSPSQRNGKDSGSSSKTCTPVPRNTNTEGSEKTVKDAFAFLKRKSEETAQNPNDKDEDDFVRNSPPRQLSKKAKMIFKKCFQSTFDPKMIPGYNQVEVEDSEEEDDQYE